MIISMELSVESVRKARNQVLEYSRSLDAKTDALCKRLAEIGVSAAKANVKVDTADLQGSISVVQQGSKDYLVVVENEHAAFVEFGTGVVGQGTYQGNLPGDWNYDERRTSEAHDPIDPTTWYYIDEDGKRRKTRGQPASGYMFAAGEEMRQSVLRIAKEVFTT